MRTVTVVGLICVTLALEEGPPPQCGAGGGAGGKCGLDDGSGSYASWETGRGAGVAGTAKCGAWCGSAALEPGTPCAIDDEVMPCSGEYWCTTTCELWNVSILQATMPAASPISCEQFVRTSAYPRGGEVCREECLLKEVRPDRYPAPTGLGFFCAPGTCDPAVQSRYRGSDKATKSGLAVLECPCNWFGSDCSDDWVEISSVLRKEALGDLQLIVFNVSEDGWRKVMAEHRPGGIVRVQAPSATAWGARPVEQPYALANDAKERVVGELEVLAGPPEQQYHHTVTEIAERVRALPVGPIEEGKGPLYINPAVGGFFNRRYAFLMDALADDTSVEHVVLVSTGAGLSGVRAAIAELLREGSGGSGTQHVKAVHLYYGLRDVRHLPYRERLERWTSSGKLRLALTVSSSDPEARTAPEPGLATGIARSNTVQILARGLPAELSAMLPASGKLYAQHVLGLDLAAGALKAAGLSLANTAVVICGRGEILRDTEAILRIVCATTPGPCDDLIARRMFTNI